MRVILIALLIVAGHAVYAGTASVTGYAPYPQGTAVRVCMFADYITKTELTLGEALVGDSGKFSVTFEVQEIEYVYLRIGNLTGFFYAELDRKITADFPQRDSLRQLNPDVVYEVPLDIFTKDSTDMNFLASDYNSKFAEFWKKNYQYFVASVSAAKLDSFHTAMDKHYVFVKKPFFHAWMDYGLATMENATFQSEVKIGARYIKNQPIRYRNNEYMNFINTFFEDYIYKWSMRKEGQCVPAVINGIANYDSLLSCTKRIPWLKNDTLRELVLLKGLMEVYNNPAYSNRNIIAVAQQASIRSKISEHRRIARNIVTMFSKIQIGQLAYALNMVNKKGERVELLEQYKGKYVYLYFYQVKNANAVREMRYMEALHKKYGKKIVFVSVSMDNDTAAWQKYLKENPKYNWAHYHYEFREKTKDDYNLFAYPVGYIIDPEGKFYAAPVDNPSGDLEYLLYRINNPKAPPLIRIEDK